MQVVDMVQQSSLGLSLHLIFGQEMDHFLDTPGVALIDCCRVHSLTLLLQSSQEANGLLFEELWTQERLELLNAAVNLLSA